MSKSNKGITLVALVITIIVLLILAGVSISLVVGDNGIMTRAKTAGEKTNKADAVETFKLAIASITSEYYSKMYDNGAPTGGVVAYANSTVDTNSTVLKKELASLWYELSGTSTELATEAGTGKKISLKKQGSTTAVEITYDVTDKGSITNIKK